MSLRVCAKFQQRHKHREKVTSCQVLIWAKSSGWRGCEWPYCALVFAVGFECILSKKGEIAKFGWCIGKSRTFAIATWHFLQWRQTETTEGPPTRIHEYMQLCFNHSINSQQHLDTLWSLVMALCLYEYFSPSFPRKLWWKEQTAKGVIIIAADTPIPFRQCLRFVKTIKQQQLLDVSNICWAFPTFLQKIMSVFFRILKWALRKMQLSSTWAI